MTDTPLRPGSPEAVDAGCTCPMMDNSYGRGHYGDGEKYGWWISERCPLHGLPAPEAPGEARS